MGSDPQTRATVVGVDVSIRAPAWGATNGSSNVKINGKVSIRAPAWGATYQVQVPERL